MSGGLRAVLTVIVLIAPLDNFKVFYSGGETVTQHIGIVAGSAEGAALCYRTICLEAPAFIGEHNHPEITMNSMPMAEHMPHIYGNDWEAVAGLMAASAHKVAKAGADFAICPDNTYHQAFK